MAPSLSCWLSRKTWGLMLWLMRRPWIKGARRRAIRMQERVGTPRWLRITEHDRWALRHGRRTLAWCYGVLLGSMLLTGCFLAALQLYEAGILQPPDDLLRGPRAAEGRSSASDLLRQ